MVVVQMLEVMPVSVVQEKVHLQSLAWQIYIQSFHQLCLLLRIDDRMCGEDWFGVMGPNGSLAMVRQPVIDIDEHLSWAMLWELRLQVIYDLVQSMHACQKRTERDEEYFRNREAELIKLGIKVVEMLNDNI